MKNQLILLKKIQDIDIQIELLEKNIADKQAVAHKLSAEAMGYNKKLEIVKKELEESENDKRTLEGEQIDYVERIKKNEERLKNIKNDKECKAATKELNTAKKDKFAKEGEINKLIVKIDEKKALISIEEERVKNSQEELQAKQLNIETNKEKWDEEIQDKIKEKMEIVKSISPALLKKYETIKEKRHGIAIVSAVSGTCLGCHMNIPPQAYIQLQKSSSDLIFCPHCHRILYWNSTPETELQNNELHA